MRFKDSVVVVTGGTMGIGRSICEGFAKEGATVVVADISGASEAATQLKDEGYHAVGFECDVASETATQALAAAVEEEFSKVDVLVNNAGLYSSLKLRPFDQIPVEEWQRVLNVNVIGQAMCIKAMVPLMRQNGGGHIVNISSGTPFKGVPYLLHYVASKGAVNAMTKALAKELGADQILVNGVAPGFTLSEGVKNNPEQVEKLRDISLKARVLQRDQEPEDVVGAVLFLASKEAGFVTGQTLVVDGGAYFH